MLSCFKFIYFLIPLNFFVVRETKNNYSEYLNDDQNEDERRIKNNNMIKKFQPPYKKFIISFKNLTNCFTYLNNFIGQ